MRALLAVAVLLALPASAGASTVYGICGPSLCAVDAGSGKREILRKGTRAEPYTAVSASTSGSVLAWVRDEEVFRARARGAGAERIGTALRQAAPSVEVRPDGGAVAWIDVVQRPDLIGGGFFYERDLLVLERGEAARDTALVATDMRSAGWLARALLRQAFGEDGAPWFICAVTASDGCVRDVAVDQDRSLDDPAGSPDGRRVAAVTLTPGDEGVAGPIGVYDARNGKLVRRVTSGDDLDPAFSPDGGSLAFVRGRDLYVVPASGGRARRLARGVSSPAWARR